MINQYVAVALGGALGATIRFAVAIFCQKYFYSIAGLATFTVNVTGCLCIGIMYVYFDLKHPGTSVLIRQFVIIGFLGAFTTYSSFSLDALKLFQQGQWLYSLVYVVVTLLLCLLATVIGMWAGKSLFD